MNIGIPKEIKAQEGRVAFLPIHVKDLVKEGHSVFIETGAGTISGAPDDDYKAAGATVLGTAGEVYEKASLIAKVKEILEPEYGFLRKDHIIFTNIHAAMNREQLDCMLNTGLTAISAENTHAFGSPNCSLAGEIGAFEAVRLSLAPHGGTGRHFMPHFGAPASSALVLGLGHVGRGALRTLLRLGVSVTGLDINPGACKAAKMDWYDNDLTVDAIEAINSYLPQADMIINCVLWPKDRDDHLISRSMLANLKPTAVIVDISCDAGGAVETCRSTTWADPVYVVDGIRHFCVDNIPGSVPATASAGYGEAILPKVRLIAEKGAVQAIKEEPWIARGLTCIDGELILEEAGKYQNRPCTPITDWIFKH